ncbi:MAG: HAD family hydrolase [Patescibacteria group bacterium]
MIKAVIFDIDGVVMDSFPANLNFFQDLMEKNGYQPPTAEEYRQIFHYNLYDAIKVLSKTTNEQEIMKMWEEGRRLAGQYYIRFSTMTIGAAKAVKALRKKYKLGIVTSRVAETMFVGPSLEELKKYFGAAVSYQDTVNHKPHPEPLLLAARKLEVRPNECVYIGDVENDIVTARAADMRVIIYSHKKFDNADACISSFKELPELIKTL